MAIVGVARTVPWAKSSRGFLYALVHGLHQSGEDVVQVIIVGPDGTGVFFGEREDFSTGLGSVAGSDDRIYS